MLLISGGHCLTSVRVLIRWRMIWSGERRLVEWGRLTNKLCASLVLEFVVTWVILSVAVEARVDKTDTVVSMVLKLSTVRT